MTDTGQVSHQITAWQMCSDEDGEGEKKRAISSRVALRFHMGTALRTLFLSCAASFPVFALPYSKRCLCTIIQEECTQAGHTGEGDTWSQLALARISRLKCTGGKGTLNTALTVRRQWLLIKQSWQGLSGLLPDQALMLRTGSCID